MSTSSIYCWDSKGLRLKEGDTVKLKISEVRYKIRKILSGNDIELVNNKYHLMTIIEGSQVELVEED